MVAAAFGGPLRRSAPGARWHEKSSAMSQPILVVGAAGQVGRELMLRGLWARPTLVGLTRRELDIRDAAKVRAVIERVAPAAVINAAAYTAVDKAETER